MGELLWGLPPSTCAFASSWVALRSAIPPGMEYCLFLISAKKGTFWTLYPFFPVLFLLTPPVKEASACSHLNDASRTEEISTGWSASLRTLWTHCGSLWQETHLLCDFCTPLPDYSHRGTLGFLATGVGWDPECLKTCIPIFLAWSYTVPWEGLRYGGVFSEGNPDPFDPWAMGGEG